MDELNKKRKEKNGNSLRIQIDIKETHLHTKTVIANS